MPKHLSLGESTMYIAHECPNCGEARLRISDPIIARGGHGPDLLPGTFSGFLGLAGGRVIAVVCLGCGLTRFFAPEEERKQIAESGNWTPLVTPPDSFDKTGYRNDPSPPR